MQPRSTPGGSEAPTNADRAAFFEMQRSGSGRRSGSRAPGLFRAGAEKRKRSREAEAEHVARKRRPKQAGGSKAEAGSRPPGFSSLGSPEAAPEERSGSRQAAARIEAGRREAEKGLF